MDRWSGRVALVTGASSGIGAAIASVLVQHGMKVVGCAPDAPDVSRIEELSVSLASTNTTGTLDAVRCDLTKEEDILDMFSHIKTKYGTLHVCVNNAGLNIAAPLLSGSTAQWREVMDVNVLALSIVTREAFQLMKSSGVDDGHIFNLCSLAGHRVMAMKNAHWYSAAKFAVNALTEGVRNELRELKSHIRVTQLSPGCVETKFHENIHGREDAEKFYKSFKALEAKDIADAVIYALSAPPHVQVQDILIAPIDLPKWHDFDKA